LRPTERQVERLVLDTNIVIDLLKKVPAVV